MATYPIVRDQEVTHIAGRILRARLTGGKGSFGSTLADSRRILSDVHPRDTFEQERLEVLESAVEFLDSPVTERAWAAMRLLEQLAEVDVRPLRRLSRPA